MSPSRSLVAHVASLSILIAPLCGCHNDASAPEQQVEPITSVEAPAPEEAPVEGAQGEEGPGEEPGSPDLTERAAGVWQSSKEMAGTGWTILTEKTKAGLVIAGEKLDEGQTTALDASNTAWVWSKDRSAEGWAWVSANAAGAAEWASDSATGVWKVMQAESGEFALWVRVEVDEGVAWTKTELPAAWDVTKDAGGQAWVWMGEHKVELSVAAAMVTVVVGALIAAPELVAVAAVKGAIGGGSAATMRFLVDTWKNREPNLDGVAWTQSIFVGMGKSVLAQSGPEILASLTSDGAG